MPPRSDVLELCQLGIETVEGTAVAATKRMSAMSVNLGIKVTVAELRAMGYKIPALEDPSKVYTSFSAQGEATYTEMIYPLSSVLKKVTPAAGGATSKVWTFDPASTGVETVASYTLEQGQTARAGKAAGAKFADFGLTLGRNGCQIRGGGFAQIYQDGITMTALTSAAEVPLVPILGTQLDFFLDTTAAAFGTTKLLSATELAFDITGMWGMQWVANSANASYKTGVQLAPKITGALTLEQDAAGMAVLGYLMAGSTFYLRGKGTGALIETSHNYSLTEDLAVKGNGDPTFASTDGVRTVKWPFTVVHDTGAVDGLKLVLENLMTAL